MQAVILCGIQGAGKTTFYRRRFPDTHLRLSLDMLRTRHREAVLLEACLSTGLSFVIDNTNPTAAERRRYIDPARAARFEVVGYYFPSQAADALAVNDRRDEPDRLPVKAILGTFKRLEVPRLAEGFSALFVVRRDTAGRFMIEPIR